MRVVGVVYPVKGRRWGSGCICYGCRRARSLPYLASMAKAIEYVEPRGCVGISHTDDANARE